MSTISDSVMLVDDPNVLVQPDGLCTPASVRKAADLLIKGATTREISTELGYKAPPAWLQSEEFLSYLDYRRKLVEVKGLPAKFRTSQLTKQIIVRSLEQILERIELSHMVGEDGEPLAKTIDEETLLRSLIPWMRLDAEVEGSIETAGSSFEYLDNLVKDISDPKRAREILESAGRSLNYQIDGAWERYKDNLKQTGGLIEAETKEASP